MPAEKLIVEGGGGWRGDIKLEKKGKCNRTVAHGCRLGLGGEREAYSIHRALHKLVIGRCI